MTMALNCRTQGICRHEPHWDELLPALRSRKSRLFADSDRGEEFAAVTYRLIHTARLSKIHGLGSLTFWPHQRSPIADLAALLTWSWARESEHRKLAA